MTVSEFDLDTVPFSDMVPPHKLVIICSPSFSPKALNHLSGVLQSVKNGFSCLYSQRRLASFLHHSLLCPDEACLLPQARLDEVTCSSDLDCTAVVKDYPRL